MLDTVAFMKISRKSKTRETSQLREGSLTNTSFENYMGLHMRQKIAECSRLFREKVAKDLLALGV